MDVGILPAGSIDMKEEMGLGNTKFGTLGSVVYLGQMIGAASTTNLLKRFKPKSVLVGCLGINIGSMILFTLTDNFLLLFICRMGTGVF
jgi:predicted MFS family arabinose efflux permease